RHIAVVKKPTVAPTNAQIAVSISIAQLMLSITSVIVRDVVVWIISMAERTDPANAPTAAPNRSVCVLMLIAYLKYSASASLVKAATTGLVTRYGRPLVVQLAVPSNRRCPPSSSSEAGVIVMSIGSNFFSELSAAHAARSSKTKTSDQPT